MLDPTNPFEAFADEMRSPRAREYVARKSDEEASRRRVNRDGSVTMDPLRARMDAAGPAGKREIERQELSKRYRRFKAEERRDLLEGQHGRNIVELLKFMRRLTINDAPALLHHIPALTWIRELDRERMFRVRSLIAAHIVRIRQRAGFHPFDDALDCFGEQPDASTAILKMLA